MATGNVNLRAGPSTAYPVVTVVPVGARIEPFIDTRVDLYSLSDLPPMMGVESDETVSRSRVSAGQARRSKTGR